MDQRPIVVYLARKSLSAVAIRANLAATLGIDARSYGSVNHFLRDAKSPLSSPSITFSERQTESDDFDETILHINHWMWVFSIRFN
jgi:hypothetical protein